MSAHGREAQATMALKAVVDSLEAVPEAQRDLYVERDGKFHLDVEGSEDVSGLKTALQRERDARKKAEERAKTALSDDDLETFERLKTEAAERERKKSEEKGEWEKLETQLKDSHKAELEKVTSRSKQLEQSLQEALIDQRATAAINEAEASVRLLLPHVRSAMKVVEQDGRFKAVVVDEKGDPRLRKDAKGSEDLMTVKDLVAEFKESDEFAGAFKGTGSTGSGSEDAGDGASQKGLGAEAKKQGVTIV